MNKYKELSKDERIKKEIDKLRGIFTDINESEFKTVEELINRAGYMLATLQDYEKDIDENGYVEMFSQSPNVEPYERERPVIRLYNTLSKNYQSIIRQLAQMLPNKPDTDDGFDDFLKRGFDKNTQ